MNWQQLYDPFNNKLLSTVVSALPVLTLFFVLVALKKRVWVSALSGLVIAVALALFVSKCQWCWLQQRLDTALFLA